MKNERIKVLSGNPLVSGATKTSRGYNFAFCSDSESIALCLYEKGSDEPAYRLELGDAYKKGSVFSVELSGVDFSKYEYIYEVEGKFVSDPYTKYITNGKDFGEDMTDIPYRSGIVSDDFDWDGDRQIGRKFSDTIIYKLHTRGFTKHMSSRVKNKGTFAGIVEKLDYIKDLGVNAIMIMPMFEFFEYKKKAFDNPYENAQVRKINYWGYTEGLYFAPKYAYSKNCRQADYTVEFKKLVKCMHENGIEVFIELFFDKKVPVSLITDCVKHWVLEYHIDGINLCCETNVFETLANEPLLSNTKLFCNYWGGINRAYGKKCKTLANMNEGFQVNARRFLKSDEDMLKSFVAAVRNNPDNATNVNFLTSHNGFTLADLVSYDRKHNEANGENNTDGPDYNYSWNCGFEGKTRKKKIVALREVQVKNAMIMLLLSQGTPLIMAGDEFLHSTLGNNNPYCQDNATTWLNWKNATTNAVFLEFVKWAVEFRKSHKILHMDTELKGFDYKAYGVPDVSFHDENAWCARMETYNRHIGIMYCGKYADEEEFIYVAYNMHWEPHKLALPNITGNKEFEVIMDTGNQSSDIIDEDGRMITVGPRSIVVLMK